jgi:hypothetical protein
MHVIRARVSTELSSVQPPPLLPPLPKRRLSQILTTPSLEAVAMWWGRGAPESVEWREGIERGRLQRWVDDCGKRLRSSWECA